MSPTMAPVLLRGRFLDRRSGDLHLHPVVIDAEARSLTFALGADVDAGEAYDALFVQPPRPLSAVAANPRACEYAAANGARLRRRAEDGAWVLQDNIDAETCVVPLEGTPRAGREGGMQHHVS